MKKRLILCGFGNVGRAFARLIHERQRQVAEKYGICLKLIAAVDIDGAAVSEQGAIPVDRLLSHVDGGGTVENMNVIGRPGVSGMEVLSNFDADILVETTPTNLKDGEPGKSHIVGALKNGLDVVSANKGPLVLYYRELLDFAREKG